MIRLLLVALSVGMSNFAASIGLSLSGVSATLRLQVILLFGVFEAGMPVVGIVVGHSLASTIGGASRWIGGGLLVATGAWTAFVPERPGGRKGPSTGRLAVTALALSVDNLVVGFALGTMAVSLPVAAGLIAGVSVALSLLGLEIGSRLGASFERWSEEIGGGVLVAVGAAVLSGLLH